MPQISAIKPQKSGKRVNIYLDDKFGFGLDLENFVALGLKVDQEFTEEEIDKIIKKAEFQKTYDKILRFASLRPRSKKEYVTWLKKYKVPLSINEELFDKLTRLEFLDDRKFAVWWVGQRIQFKNKSKRVISLELRQKGVAKDIIDEVLTEENIDERKMARKLLEKKDHVWTRLNNFDMRRKKSEYLLRNGFSWDIIKDIFSEND